MIKCETEGGSHASMSNSKLPCKSFSVFPPSLSSPPSQEMETLVFRYTSSLLATALKLLQYLFLGLALLTSATAIYAVAYQLIMPTKLHEKELFFDYFPPAVSAVGTVEYGRGGPGGWPGPYPAAAAAATAAASADATGAGAGYGSSFNSPEKANAAAAHSVTMITGENPPSPSAPPPPQDAVDSSSPSSSPSTPSSPPSNTCASPTPPFFPPSYHHPFPHATVDFLSKHNQWHASPLTKTDTPLDRILRPDRVYVIDIEMTLPDSEPNAFLGNFMVSVDLFTRGNELLARSARPLILLYRSHWVRIIRSFFLAPFWALGLSQEAQVVRVTLFDRFRESGAHPMAWARVTLSSPQVHVYKATLSITAQLNWLQFVMSYYFYSTAFCAILLLATMLAAVVGFVYVWTELEGEEEEARQGGREDEEEDAWGNGGGLMAGGSGRRGGGRGRGREGGGFGAGSHHYQQQNAANDETETLLGAEGGREGEMDRGEGRAMVQVAEGGDGGGREEGEGGRGGDLSSPASMTTRSVFLVDDDGGQVEGGGEGGGGVAGGGGREELQTISGSPTVVPMSSSQSVTLTGGGTQGGGDDPQPQQSQGVRRRGQHHHHHHYHRHHQHGQGDEDDDEEFLLGATSN